MSKYSQLFFITAIGLLSCLSSARAGNSEQFNSLKNVHVVKNGISLQVLFECSQAPLFKTEQKNNQNKEAQLIVDFSGMECTEGCTFENISQRMKLLKDHGILSAFEISKGSGVVPGIHVVFTFAPTRIERNTAVNNELVIRWSKVDKNREQSVCQLVLDIMTKNDLKKIESHNDILLQAKNDFEAKKKILV